MVAQKNKSGKNRKGAGRKAKTSSLPRPSELWLAIWQMIELVYIYEDSQRTRQKLSEKLLPLIRVFQNEIAAKLKENDRSHFEFERANEIVVNLGPSFGEISRLWTSGKIDKTECRRRVLSLVDSFWPEFHLAGVRSTEQIAGFARVMVDGITSKNPHRPGRSSLEIARYYLRAGLKVPTHPATLKTSAKRFYAESFGAKNRGDPRIWLGRLLEGVPIGTDRIENALAILFGD